MKAPEIMMLCIAFVFLVWCFMGELPALFCGVVVLLAADKFVER